MKILISALILTLSTACTSPQLKPITDLNPEAKSPTNEELTNTSQVLAIANKCPKHSKYIDGKCRLQVEVAE